MHWSGVMVMAISHEASRAIATTEKRVRQYSPAFAGDANTG